MRLYVQAFIYIIIIAGGSSVVLAAIDGMLQATGHTKEQPKQDDATDTNAP